MVGLKRKRIRTLLKIISTALGNILVLLLLVLQAACKLMKRRTTDRHRICLQTFHIVNRRVVR